MLYFYFLASNILKCNTLLTPQYQQFFYSVREINQIASGDHTKTYML